MKVPDLAHMSKINQQNLSNNLPIDLSSLK